MPSVSKGRHESGSQFAACPAKVLHIITRMVKGGAQENVLDMTVRLNADRFQSMLITGPSEGPEGSLVEKAIERGADIREIPWLVREISPLNDLRAIISLVRLIRSEKPDIVYTHTSKAGIVGRLAARAARAPVVIHEPHGHIFHGYYGKLKSAIFIAMERWCARYANRLVMLTENERADHLALKIAPAEKFITIHSGVDFSKMLSDKSERGALRNSLGIPASGLIIGTVGRLEEVKGHIHLIEAMPAIVNRIPHAHVVLIGSGQLRESLEQRAAHLGVKDNLHFAGYRPDVSACLKDMDLFVLPSLNEGMGRVLVEAMVMRLPVVASDVCGIRDLVQDGCNGRLVPVANPGAISGAVIEILADKELALRMGAEGFKIAVPEYGVDAMVVALENMYSSEMAKIPIKH